MVNKVKAFLNQPVVTLMGWHVTVGVALVALAVLWFVFLRK